MPTPKDLLTAQHCDYTKDFKESIIRYVVEADDCLNKKDDFINLTFNVITGILNISTDTSHIPNITYPITYYLFIDGEEILDFTVNSENNLEYSTQLPTLDNNGEIDKHYIELIVASEDKSKGCSFLMETSSISKSDYELVQNNSTYELRFNNPLNQYTIMDLNSLDIIWGIRNGVVLTGETQPSITISTVSLYRLTQSSTVVLYVKFKDVIIYTDEIGIPESEIELDIELINVLNGTTFYTNINTSITAGNNTVYTYLYLDNQKLSETHIETIPNAGKTVTVVLTLEEDSVGDIFDEADTSKYFLHKSAVVTDDYELDMTFPINGANDNKFISSENSNRELQFIKYSTTTNFLDTVNYKQPIQFTSIRDSSDAITVVNNSIGLDPNFIRQGLIIDDVYYDPINEVSVDGLRVYNKELNLEPVSLENLLDKKVKEINQLQTLAFKTIADFQEYGFTGDTSSYYLISDRYIGFNSNNSSIISKQFNADNVLYGIQFELEYGDIANNIPVFILIKVYDINGSLHSTYGYEKIDEGLMKSTDSKGTVKVSGITSGSLYINKSFANIYDIGRIDIQVSGGLSSQLALRNLFIDVIVGNNNG